MLFALPRVADTEPVDVPQPLKRNSSSDSSKSLQFINDERQIALAFAERHRNDCDEFVTNRIYGALEAPGTHRIQRNQIRNILHVNDATGRETHARMYQRSDLHVARAAKVCRA